MPFKSMTGYGSAVWRENGVQVNAEILSVNRKHLDINIILPRNLSRFDPDIRKLISSSVFRGHITVRISLAFEEDFPFVVKPNIALAKELYRGWQYIAEGIGIDATSMFSLSLLEKEPELFSFEASPLLERMQPVILKAVEESLKPFLAMRRNEGDLIEADIIKKLEGIKNEVKEIEKHITHATSRYRQKLLNNLREVLPTLDSIDDRLLKEIAIFAEKVDIAEEIVRLYSHLQQFEQLLLDEKDTPGKTAEFLLQELNREINTIGSKSSELAVTHIVVNVKAELERIREQMQNVE